VNDESHSSLTKADSGASGRRQVKSVANAMRLLIELGSVSQQADEIGVTELSRRLGLGVSTVHVLLSTLADFGFAESSSSGRYRLGLTAFEVGVSVPEYVRLCEPLIPDLERLSASSEEAASIAVRRGRDALIIARSESAHILRADIRIGTSMPLHASASGKCFLSWLAEEQVRDLYDNETLIARGTPKAVKHLRELQRELRQVRKQGHAANRDEFVDGVAAVAAPIRGRAGGVAAVLSLAGPSTRFDPETWAKAVMDTAAGMSSTLGFREVA
jgi:DNA-binding IclR family transcriptional regulator